MSAIAATEPSSEDVGRPGKIPMDISRGARVILIGVVLLCIEGIAPGVSVATLCMPRVTETPRMPDDFALALVDALIALDMANHHISEAKTLGDFVGALPLARCDFECAVLVMDPFKTSKEEKISKGATGFSSAVGGMIANQAAAGQLYKVVLDGTSSTGEGTLSETLGKLSALAESDWDLLITSVGLATFAFVDPKLNPATGKMNQSRLTRQTMTTAREDLERVFGKLSLDTNANLSKIEAVVAGLQRLFNPPFQPSDEQASVPSKN